MPRKRRNALSGHGDMRETIYVSVSPAYYSGQPCITWRIPPEIPAAVWWDGHGDVDYITKNWPSITRAHLLVACWYLGEYGSRTWRQRFRAWALYAHCYLWLSEYDDCPLPPRDGEPWEEPADADAILDALMARHFGTRKTGEG